MGFEQPATGLMNVFQVHAQVNIGFSKPYLVRTDKVFLQTEDRLNRYAGTGQCPPPDHAAYVAAFCSALHADTG